MTGRKVSVKFSDGTAHTGFWGAKCEFPGDYVLNPGDVCMVIPCNSQKKKHRNRKCELLDSYTSYKVKVLFLDTNTKGSVEVSDLVPYQVANAQSSQVSG